MITLIAAVSKNNVIGDSTLKTMPWKCPAELAFFRENTMGKIVVMGRKTVKQVGRLQGRDCIMLTRNPKQIMLNLFRPINLQDLLEMERGNPELHFAICGGAEIYKQLEPYAHHALISYMNFDAKGDILWEELDAKWVETSSHPFEQFTACAYTNCNPLFY
jgi:dihydrofolate reductase